LSSSLHIKYEMQAFDRKDRAYYDNFTDEDRKKFSTYLMLKYGANVGSGSYDLQAYYLMATNNNVNKWFFDLGSKHTKLQWLTCTAVSPSMGPQFHYWLKAKKKQGDNKSQKFLAKLYPNMKQDEIDLMATLNDKKELKKLAQSLGIPDKEIKKDLG
jgi:hypothetical protein